MIFADVREPFILRQLGKWLAAMQARFADRVAEVFRGCVAPDGDVPYRVAGGVCGVGDADARGHDPGFNPVVGSASAPPSSIAPDPR